jgi:hypothetical protein
MGHLPVVATLLERCVAAMHRVAARNPRQVDIRPRAIRATPSDNRRPTARQSERHRAVPRQPDQHAWRLIGGSEIGAAALIAYLGIGRQ